MHKHTANSSPALHVILTYSLRKYQTFGETHRDPPHLTHYISIKFEFVGLLSTILEIGLGFGRLFQMCDFAMSTIVMSSIFVFV